MPTGQLHGKNVEFYYRNVLITGITEISGIGVAGAPVAETTAIGDAWQHHIKGAPGGGTFSLSGTVPAGTTDHKGLGAAASDTSDGEYRYYTGDDAATPGSIIGRAYVTTFTMSAPFGGAQTWSATFQITDSVDYS